MFSFHVNSVYNDAKKWSSVRHAHSRWFFTVYLRLYNLYKKRVFWDYFTLNPPPSSHCTIVKFIIFCIIHLSVAGQGQRCSLGQQRRDRSCPHLSLISSQCSVPLESQTFWNIYTCFNIQYISGVVVPGEVGILLIYAPNFFFKRPGKGWTTCVINSDM